MPVLALALSPALSACQKEEVEVVDPPPIADGKPVAKSPDRLPPGKLLEGTEEAYGFAVPRGMEVTYPTRKSALIAGSVDFDDLTDYVKDRIIVRHAELIHGKLVFRNARIKGQKDMLFDLSIAEGSAKTQLRITNRTRLPTETGPSEPERWKKHGLRPDGGLIDPNSME
jgi:hypothetical protein